MNRAAYNLILWAMRSARYQTLSGASSPNDGFKQISFATNQRWAPKLATLALRKYQALRTSPCFAICTANAIYHQLFRAQRLTAPPDDVAPL